jgi:radical SAM superfamily enzyme YgiQ (UPF0313 family)
LKKALENLDRIVKSGKVHVHADLIAGLPYEDYCSFRNSFNDVYKVKAAPSAGWIPKVP